MTTGRRDRQLELTLCDGERGTGRWLRVGFDTKAARLTTDGRLTDALTSLVARSNGGTNGAKLNTCSRADSCKKLLHLLIECMITMEEATLSHTPSMHADVR